MPKMSGLELQASLKEEECNIPIIFITAMETPGCVLQAMRREQSSSLQNRSIINCCSKGFGPLLICEQPGFSQWAQDLVCKDFCRRTSAAVTNAGTADQVERTLGQDDRQWLPAPRVPFWTRWSRFSHRFDCPRRGRPGTGKELVDHALHNASQRCGRSFIKLNCAAIPLDLLESELFGHLRGESISPERSRRR